VRYDDRVPGGVEPSDSIWKPDQLVFDLDPPDEGFGMAVEAALLLKDEISELGLEGFSPVPSCAFPRFHRVRMS
jgi:hypothetical protein